MKATGFNHVSINAHNLAESVRFYEEVFGLEKIPTYNFGFPVQYFRLGDLQLHIFEREETEAPTYHHFGIDVDDFEAAYRKAKELGIEDERHFPADVYELPDGAVQMYVRDPAGNLVEIDMAGVDRLPDDLRAQLKGLWDFNPQDDDQMSARLFVPE